MEWRKEKEERKNYRVTTASSATGDGEESKEDTDGDKRTRKDE